jgi:methyl-accepting chemotaxis protein
MLTRVAMARAVRSDVGGAAARLCSRFREASTEARAGGLTESISVALVDGLCGVGDKLIDAILEHTRPSQPIVGGAAGDDGAFRSTLVGTAREAAPEAALVAHVFCADPWGIGVGHGLRAASSRMKVTRASGNRVYTIDGKPAFDVYRQYAEKRGVDLKREDAGPFLIGNELGVYFFDTIRHARAPLAVEVDGSLMCAAEVEQGASVCILDGDRSSMVDAARKAAEQARSTLQGNAASAVLLFDCVCRGMILDFAFEREIEAVRSVFPGVPICGFLTYGEIARARGRLEGWHNTTAVVAAMPA